MYAIVQTGGKQYRVSEGDIINVEKLDVEEDKITLDSSFRQDLGADSLDTYELVYAIEEELKVTIPDEKANEFETVRDAYDFIKANQA